jgi:cell surface protein SprA
MKNIYDLKARSIDEEGFDLKVYYNGENQPKEYDARGLSYLRNFGLDNFTQNGTVGHDGKIDLKANIVKLSEGELWIPYVLPFEAPAEGNTSSGVYNDSLDFADGSDRPSIDEIYNLSYTDPLRKSLDYYIEVKYSNRSSTIDLGEMFIIEGSEEILVNGAKMEKGIDYDIDYFSGLITLKSVRAMDANAKIDINYETEQLFGGIGEQKLMAGLRAEYRINEKAFIGATAMYYDRSVLDDKNVNIGDEPFKNFIWDVNGEFEYDLNWLDRAMNALPFIRIRKASRMKLSGEIAQILPNPNTIENEESGDFDGVAKLDDFESASQETPMNINFQKWTHASKPENTFFASTFTERGFLFWYNPFYVGANGAKVFGIYTKNIWPQKETTESDQYTSVLNVVLDPTVNGITGHETESDTRQVWGGIMQPVYMYDQSNSKYIELWVKGEKGQLQIDIGEITEDWYNTNYDVSFPESELGDGEKNYEDKDNNGSLESTTYYNEDIGINGLTDEEEIARGWDPMIDNFDKEGYKVGEVRYCNGSENNAGTDGIQPYPETEDIDRDGKLDQANSYYSYTLDLSSEEWLASRTYYDGNSGATGWKKYLIPLTAMIDSVGKPSFTSIRMMRLNMFGVEDQDTLQIAGISIVGNEWQELGLASDDEPFYKKDDDRFYITVKNTDEDDDYQSPPGIEGREQVNPFGGETIREKEQALVLNLVGFQPGETALAEKIMLSSESLLMYKKLKMFVHGDDNITDENSPLNVFLRIGRGDMTEYYEAVTSVYSGWEDENNIEIVFDQITRLKNRVDFDGIEYFSYDKGFIKEYRPIDITTGEYTGKIYRVVGDPTLSRIEKMQLGVINVDPFINYTGEIWVNEMRVVESNNDPGMAMRGNFDFSLGDFMNFNINAKKMDADFRQVNQQMSSNTNSSEALNMSMTLKAHKLFPDKWKLSIPITMSQTQSEYTPKYFPGSDILLGDDPDDSLITRSTNQSISTSIGRSGTNTDNALMKYFINPISAKVSMAKAMNTTLETLSSENTSTSGNFQYNLSIPKGKGIPYLSWIPFLSDKAKEEKFYLTPTSFKWNMSIAEAEREWITRSTLDTNNTYSFYMNKGMSLNYSPFESMKFTYSRDSKADLYDYRFDKWKLFSDISYDSLMNGVNVGDVTNMSENTGLTYNPILTSWLKPRLSYSSVYKYNSSKNVNYATVGVTRTISGSLTLSLKQIWDTYEKQFQDMNKRRQNAAPKPNLNQIPQREDDRDFAKKDMAPDTRPKAKTTVSKKSKPFSVSNLLAKIDPISLSYSNNFSKGNSGITGSDSTKIYKNVVYKYRYGLVDYYSLPTGSFENTILRPMTNSLKEQISIGSGIKLTKTISLKLNYKQNTSSGRDYTYKTNAGAFYDEPTHIVVYGDTLELSPYDSSASRNYIPLGETGKDGFVAPDYSLNWSITPSQFKWLKGKLDFIKKISLQHQMSGKESIRYIQRTDRFPYYMESTSSTYNLNFTPLIKAGFIFTGNLRADFAYNKTIKIDHSGDVELDYFNTGIVRTYQDNITFNMSYEYNKGLSIPVPFLKNVQVLNLNNEITFSLQGKYGLNKVIVKQKASEVFDSPRDYMITWEVEPQVSYRFSKNIDGRFFFKYGQRIDMKQSGAIEGENKYDDYKDFGVTVTIRISG